LKVVRPSPLAKRFDCVESRHADYELRAGQWRVFYRIQGEERVGVTLIGERRSATLFVEGEVFEL
jgi:hypothetical protein